MKNLSIGDIKALTDKIKSDLKLVESGYQKKAFKIYDQSEVIQGLISRAENMENVDYCFNQFGDFVGIFEVPDQILKLPFIGEYFFHSQSCCSIGPHGIEINLMPPITVNWGHDRREYFVVDQETGDCLIESSKDIEDNEELTLLIIERYMRKTGVFGDVISIDSRYGQYISHIDTGMGTLSDEEVNSRYDQIMNAGKSEEEEE